MEGVKKGKIQRLQDEVKRLKAELALKKEMKGIDPEIKQFDHLNSLTKT